MKIILSVTLLILSGMIASAQQKIKISAGDRVITATLADNDATRELISLLTTEPLTISMNDNGGFEKVGELPESLTTSNTQINAEPGDIMLYLGRYLVIFYGTNSWSYTRLGKIDLEYVSDLRQILGNGDITVTLSIDSLTEVPEITNGTDMVSEVYDLNGRKLKESNRKISDLPSGIYIFNGNKVKR